VHPLHPWNELVEVGRQRQTDEGVTAQVGIDITLDGHLDDVDVRELAPDALRAGAVDLVQQSHRFTVGART
jgi:hypothetical protein